MRSRRTARRWQSLAAAAVLPVALLAAQPVAPATAAPAASSLNWSPCYQDVGAETGVTYQCATLQVPLDYGTPAGGSVQIAVVKVPARDPEHRIGSLFLNPGGPGGSGVDFALFFGPFAGELLGEDVRDRFDIVGFDPRGVGRSAALRCFGNLKQSTRVFAPFAFPMTPEEEAVVATGDQLLADQCAKRGSKLAEHMSTANVARDLDRLRAAVGDGQLTYLGLSYGSYLGTTYANLFPDRVRALVVDGVLDPLAWANVEGTVPFSTRLRSDQGAQTTLEKFFTLCDAAGPDCSFAPDSQDRFVDLADRLRAGPVIVTDSETGEQFPFTYADLIGTTLGALYDPFSFPFLADFLAELEAQASAARIGASLGRLASVNGLVNKRGFPHYPNFVEAFPAVACEDGNNPDDHAVWSQQGAAADAQFGYFGRLWTWASSPCASWRLEDGDRYLGPFNRHTANPVLVIGNRYDPATRYQGAETVAGLLPGSALLTVDVPGHTSLGASPCAGALTGAYLLDPGQAAGIDGVVCPPEIDFFASAARSTSDARALRHLLMPITAGRP